VTGKTPEGVLQLYDAIEVALEPTPNASVHLVFSRYPVWVNHEHRERIVEQVVAIASQVDRTGTGGVFWEDVDDRKNAGPIKIGIQVLPVPRLGQGFKISWETEAGDLSTPMSAVEHAVFAIGEEPAKRSQAASMPTLLAVDVSRIGAGWIRPPNVWAQMLRAGMPAAFPFAGLAVVTPSLDQEDTEIGLALRETVDEDAVRSIRELAGRLGLEPVN
jgi:hypothetical protein